jgi:hypothetical protein
MRGPTCAETVNRARARMPLPYVLSHGALLLPHCLPTVRCSAGRAVGDHSAVRPHAHAISASAARRHRRSVYRGAIVWTSFPLVLRACGVKRRIPSSTGRARLCCSPNCSFAVQEPWQKSVLAKPSPPFSSGCGAVHLVAAIPHAGFRALHCTWRRRPPGSGHGGEKMCRLGGPAAPEDPAEPLAP